MEWQQKSPSWGIVASTSFHVSFGLSEFGDQFLPQTLAKMTKDVASYLSDKTGAEGPISNP